MDHPVYAENFRAGKWGNVSILEGGALPPKTPWLRGWSESQYVLGLVWVFVCKCVCTCMCVCLWVCDSVSMCAGGRGVGPIFHAGPN